MHPARADRPLVHPRPGRIVGHGDRLLAGSLLPQTCCKAAKRLGFSDEQVGVLADMLPEQVRESAGTPGTSAPSTRWWTPAPPSSRRSPLLLQHLRAGERGPAAGGAQSHRRGQRPHPDRPGHRVRLLQRPRRLGPTGGGVSKASWSTPTLRPYPPTSTPATASTSSPWTRRVCGTSSRTRPRETGHPLGGPVRRPDGHRSFPEPGPGRPAPAGLGCRGHRHRLRPPQVRGVPGTAGHPQPPGGSRDLGGGGAQGGPGHRLSGGGASQLRPWVAGPWR